VLNKDRIGVQFVEWLDGLACEGLWNNIDLIHCDEELEEGEPVYTMCGDYIREDDWIDYWSQFPDWYEMVYMLSDNGSYSSEEVGAMTIDQARDAYHDPETEFENVFFTVLE